MAVQLPPIPSTVEGKLSCCAAWDREKAHLCQHVCGMRAGRIAWPSDEPGESRALNETCDVLCRVEALSWDT